MHLYFQKNIPLNAKQRGFSIENLVQFFDENENGEKLLQKCENNARDVTKRQNLEIKKNVYTF